MSVDVRLAGEDTLRWMTWEKFECSLPRDEDDKDDYNDYDDSDGRSNLSLTRMISSVDERWRLRASGTSPETVLHLVTKLR